MEQRQSEFTSQNREPAMWSRLRAMFLSRGRLIGGYIKSAIWLSASSKSSNGFAESPPDMTNWMLLFSPLFTSLQSLFCWFSTPSLIFQTRPNLYLFQQFNGMDWIMVIPCGQHKFNRVPQSIHNYVFSPPLLRPTALSAVFSPSVGTFVNLDTWYR